MDNPKYTYGEIVEFTVNNESKIGSIYIVDAHGTFENPGVVSYDIMVSTENCLYKHIPEDDVLKFIMCNPIVDNRIVYDMTFASKLKTYLKNTSSVDDPINYTLRSYLDAIAEKLMRYQEYTCPQTNIMEKNFIKALKEHAKKSESNS